MHNINYYSITSNFVEVYIYKKKKTISAKT